MTTETTARGFELLTHAKYASPGYETGGGEETRLAQASSAIGNYDDALDRPGTSYLWIGKEHHLNREEVREFIRQLQAWLDTGGFAFTTASSPRTPAT